MHPLKRFSVVMKFGICFFKVFVFTCSGAVKVVKLWSGFVGAFPRVLRRLDFLFDIRACFCLKISFTKAICVRNYPKCKKTSLWDNGSRYTKDFANESRTFIPLTERSNTWVIPRAQKVDAGIMELACKRKCVIPGDANPAIGIIKIETWQRNGSNDPNMPVIRWMVYPSCYKIGVWDNKPQQQLLAPNDSKFLSAPPTAQ